MSASDQTPKKSSSSRNIVCLETTYDGRLENRSSVLPMLEMLHQTRGIRHIHFSCNTRGEFDFNLGSVGYRPTFGILYLAGHGTSGTMHLRDGSKVTLDDLTQVMENRFAHWVVHLGGCETLLNATRDVRRFIKQTDVSLVTGYTKAVDWIESAAADLLLFDALQNDDDVFTAWQTLQNKHSGLVRTLGLKAIEPTT